MKIIDPRGPLARVGHRWVGAVGAALERVAAGRRTLWLLPLAAVPVVAPVRLSDADGASADATAQGAEVSVPAEVHLLGATLPLEITPRVAWWVDRFQNDQRAAFQRLLDRKGVYDELIRDRLRRRGIPEELVYLAMMESGLSARAVSHASAVGLWQFMDPTARQYGLRVDGWVDERRDPVRATEAAVEYLSWLHQRYGSWYLAAAAYNAGPGRVDRELRRHAGGKTGDDGLYWQIAPYLPRETREYVPRLVAATLVAENAKALGFSASSAEPYRFDRVFVPGGTSLRRIAGALEVPVRVLRDLNPHLIQGTTPPGELYPVRVPVGLAPAVVEALAQ